MSDANIEYVIKIVADAAWTLASLEDCGQGDPNRNLCLRIEDLSDDPIVSKNLLAHVKAQLARDKKSSDWEMHITAWFEEAKLA